MANYESILSPVPGIIYLQPAPGEDVYVKPGSFVKKGDVVALIEVMKSFFEIQAENDGILENFNVNNGDTVDAGTEIASLKIVENVG